MPAYMIFLREDAVVDADAMARYGAMNRANARGFARDHGLRPLAVYGATQAFEGHTPDGVILLEFPSADAARAWYASPEYQAAIPERQRGAPYRAILVEGLATTPPAAATDIPAETP